MATKKSRSKSSKKATSKKRKTTPERSSKAIEILTDARTVAAVGAAVAAGVAAAGVLMMAKRDDDQESVAQCALQTRGAVSSLVLRYIRGRGFPAAVEASNFTTHVPVDPVARRAWAIDLCELVAEQGCNCGSFGPEDTSGATTIGGIVDKLAGALHVS